MEAFQFTPCFCPCHRNALPDPIVLEPIINQGTVITVTTTADDVNGNVSTVQELINDPGPEVENLIYMAQGVGGGVAVVRGKYGVGISP